MRLCAILFVSSLLILARDALPYELTTHGYLSDASFDQSLLHDNASRARLGLAGALGDPLLQFPDSSGKRQSIRQLLNLGDQKEDNNPRPINHFFNPSDGQPLHYGSMVLGATSPDWALGDSLGNTLINQFSYKDARNSFYGALTNSNLISRSAYWGLTFESLGHVIHHLQDMAQPQHVRNDQHLDQQSINDTCTPPPTLNPPLFAFCTAYQLVHNKSVYETWTDQRLLDGNPLPTTGYSPVYDALGVGVDGQTTFTTPRAFWVYEGKGIAEFTNRNFFSSGTLDLTPPVPVLPYDVSVQVLCAGALPPCTIPRPWPADEFVTFFQSNVTDQFRAAQSTVHPYAQGVSIFDPEFNTYTNQRVPSVNRFTFAKDHDLLLPRAVAYSAGLINYFFRGDMEIGLPPEGIYAIVDTSSTGCGTPCGFRKMRLLLKNGTPHDDMGDGTLVVVVKYHSNQCSRPDLSGDFGGPNFSGNNCRSIDEYITVSDPVPVKAGDIDRTAFSKPLEFTFSAATIPLYSSDILLQVVFRGMLGAEDDAVAVTTLDITEPNFVSVANITDYAYADIGDQKYHPVSQLPYNTTVMLDAVQFGFTDLASRPPIASLTTFGAGQHAQFAFLADKSAGTNFWLHTASSESYYPEDNVPFDLDTFGLDESGPVPVYKRTCPVVLERGMYRQFFRYFAQIVHGIIGAKTQLVAMKDASSTKGSGGAFKSAATCYVAPPPGSGGQADLSSMLPLFAPPGATQWQINF